MKTAKSQYSMRTSYLAIWCYALCFAHCKTFAEQSALARWRINSSPHFIWLYGRQSFYKLNRPFWLKQILLASFTSTDVVLRTLFCFSQNARRAICTHSLTSEPVASRRLIIVLDRLEALGFVFIENVNVDIRGDFGVASPVCSERVGENEMLGKAELEMTVNRNEMLRLRRNMK